MKKTYSEQEVLQKLTALCAAAEHCSQEMVEKMTRWEIPQEVQARVMQYLTEHQYIDDERFCRAFVSDKIKYNKWGQKKIDQALFLKRIPQEIRQRVLNEIDPDDYVSILRQLLTVKRKSIRANSSYELNGKLIRFAMQRGFTMDIIRQCLEVEED